MFGGLASFSLRFPPYLLVSSTTPLQSSIACLAVSAPPQIHKWFLLLVEEKNTSGSCAQFAVNIFTTAITCHLPFTNDLFRCRTYVMHRIPCMLSHIVNGVLTAIFVSLGCVGITSTSRLPAASASSLPWIHT